MACRATDPFTFKRSLTTEGVMSLAFQRARLEARFCYVFGLGDLPICHRSPPHSDVKPIFSNPMSVFLGFQTLFKLPILSILRCGKLPDVLHLSSHKMDLNNVQTLHLAGIRRSNIFHQLQVASRWIRSFSLKNFW